jgi:hypothetical protein
VGAAKTITVVKELVGDRPADRHQNAPIVAGLAAATRSASAPISAKDRPTRTPDEHDDSGDHDRRRRRGRRP